jgi:hypothetical protein
MNPIILKLTFYSSSIEKDKLHNEIIKYKFIKYVDKSRIDGNYLYILYRIDKIFSRSYKINKLMKIIKKESVNIDIYIPTEKNIEDFMDIYRQYFALVTLMEDHLPGYFYTKII